MQAASLPANEAERLAALHSYELLDTAREAAFDDITALAAHLCRTPIALISLVDESRQWFKSSVGLELPETPRDLAFCAHAILEPGELLVVEDAARDPRFADNPLVTADPCIRFYAGAPLVTPEGHALGTLCVIDRVLRLLTAEEQQALLMFSRHVITLLQLRCNTAKLERDISERKRTQREMEHKVAAAKLPDSLAQIVYETQSPEEAIRACLERICDHGGWVLGRLGIYASAGRRIFLDRSVWYEKYPNRFDEIKAATKDAWTLLPEGGFASAVVRENKPIWLEDLTQSPPDSRRVIAVRCGLRSAFAFPIKVHGKVAAFFEFFAERPRSQDDLLVAAAPNVAAVLGGLIERTDAAVKREQLAAIVENSGDAIWSRSADDTLISWNAAAEHLFGWARDEVVGERGSFLVPPDRAHETQDMPARLAHGEDSITVDTVRLRRDGTRIDVKITASVVRDALGDIAWTAFVAHDITARKQAERNSRDAAQRLQSMSHQLLETQETERARIARELHDQVGQSLTALKITLQMIERNTGSTAFARPLGDCVQITDTTLQQLRTMMLELRPPQLDELGLAIALRSHAEQRLSPTELKLHLTANKLPQTLSHVVEISCFRIAQEALTNILRHAAARNVWIRVGGGARKLSLTVRDDGQGFDYTAARQRALRGASMGLFGMEERAALAGGSIEVDSAPGAGTTLRAEFPLTRDSRRGGA